MDCRAVAGDEAEFEHGFDMLLAADFEDFEADLRERDCACARLKRFLRIISLFFGASAVEMESRLSK